MGPPEANQRRELYQPLDISRTRCFRIDRPWRSFAQSAAAGKIECSRPAQVTEKRGHFHGNVTGTGGITFKM